MHNKLCMMGIDKFVTRAEVRYEMTFSPLDIV